MPPTQKEGRLSAKGGKRKGSGQAASPDWSRPQSVDRAPVQPIKPPTDAMKSKVKPAREGLDTCLYMPGKVEGKALHYLLDTGCSGNVLSKAMFNRLPASIQESLKVKRASAFMAVIHIILCNRVKHS